jgi:predicted RNA-binding Zn ribbon-like protein
VGTASAPGFEWVGNHPALDFCNTIAWDADGPRGPDRFATYLDVVGWGVESGMMDRRAATRLREAAAADPRGAERALGRARDARRYLHSVFVGPARSVPADPVAVAQVNRLLRGALEEMTLVQSEGGFRWGWPKPESDLDRVLWPVLWAAGRLLTEGDLARVGECANPTCGWLFLDTSRNGRRRWCDMAHCGNRAKARRHYQKVKDHSTEAT